MRLNNAVNGSTVPYDGQRFQITRNLSMTAGSSLCISCLYGAITEGNFCDHQHGKVGLLVLFDSKY